MAQPTIDIRANTGQAQKELQNFGKQITGIAKVWENVMGGKGSRQASSNLQQLSKGVDGLAKSAERANMRLAAINKTLEATVKTRMRLVDTQGRVGQKDRDQYESLLQQEKSLAGQQKSWTNIAAIRSRMAQDAGQSGPGAAGSGGRGGSFFTRMGGSLFGQATSGLSGAATSLIGGGGAAAIMEGLGPVLGAAVLAAVGVGVSGFSSAFKQDETLVNFLPRMRPGGMGSTNTVGLARRMRGVGRPLAYNAEESLSVFQAMSEGGSNFGHGLERDTKSSMQFARMFGLDAGGVASMNATAERMGGFKAGDAKKFASMLATEIARTGLGPRAQEVQEATLMLMNQQMQTNPRANAAPLMALQTILNKTGVPAFQGTAGASFISQLNQGITNPNSEGTEALLMQAAQKAGVHTLFGFEMFKGQGLNNAKTLPAILRTIRGSSHNPQEAQMVLSQAFNLPLPKVHALFQATNGFRDLSSGAIQSAMKGLQGGEGFLDKGAKTTTEAFPSLDIKRAQIVIHEGTLRIGENLLPKVGSLARGIYRFGEPMASGSGSANPLVRQAAEAVDAARGWPKGTTSLDFSSTANAVKSIAGMVLNPKVFRPGVNPLTKIKDDFLHDIAHGLDFAFKVGPNTHFEGMGAAPAAGLLGAMQDMRKAGLHPTISSAFRTRAEQQRAKRRRDMGLAAYPAARPGHSAHEHGTAVDITVPAGERDQVTGIMAAHGFAHNVPGDPVHYTYAIHIHDHTSDHRAKRLVKDAIQEHHHETTRSKVNTRNMRR